MRAYGACPQGPPSGRLCRRQRNRSAPAVAAWQIQALHALVEEQRNVIFIFNDLMKGLTSIELAILLAIIIVIAVAVGWYMYTTFLGATQSQAKLVIVNAVYSASKGYLNLTLTNPGPVNTVTIQAVYLNGQSCSGTAQVSVSQGPQTFQFTCPANMAAAGTTLQGQVVIASGATFPFTASVVP